MQELINLVLLFQRTKFKVSGMMSIVLEPDSEMERFYNAIAGGFVKTEDDARAVFPEYAQNPARLHTIKGKLKERLNDSILLLDFRESAFTERQHAFYACSRKWAASMTLMTKNARENGINLLENLLRQTLRFEFTELTVDILRTLRLHYGILEGDQKRFDQIEQQLNQYEEYWIMERKTEGYYAELVTRYVRNKSQKEEISKKAREYFDRVKPYLEQCSTFKVQFFGRMLEILIYDSMQDYPVTARLCEQALEFFDKKDYVSNTVLQVFNYNLFTCYLHMRQFDKCLLMAREHQDLFEDGTYNWFKLQELYFLSAMHSGNYSDGLRISLAVAAHPNFEHQPAPVIETWKIFEAYIALLAYGGLIAVPDTVSKFKISRFVNEIQFFSKDKSGMNIPVLVVQFLFDLAQHRWPQIIDRAEGLSKYRSRYVNSPDMARSQCFMRMLEQVPKASFLLPEVQKRTADTWKQLTILPSSTHNPDTEIEIVPYDVLWGIVLNILGKPRHCELFAAAPIPAQRSRI
ncbi:MAG: hypothetical protein JNJ90_05430 [Saprospiraceae bacterium]|jgi:hypothetical protein|nr:hypothetical protein [Saprospiraceae bacterium]